MGKHHRSACPTPTKTAHRTQRLAELAAHRKAIDIVAHGGHFDPTYGYRCRCGAWHLTRKAFWDGQPNVLLRSVPDELQAWALPPRVRA